MNSKKHDDIGPYDDIIHLPHHTSKKRKRMPVSDRAAQFAPFSAVVGHESAVKEAARITDRKRELDETEKAIIDKELRAIEAGLPGGFEIEIVYFQPDEKKDGGKYVAEIGKVKKLDKYQGKIHMVDGTCISIEDVISIVSNP